ncbi:MAG: hypothetical protein A2V83_07955 [Nitrospirae bacterium RBG_16_64_22]|nr:MAG: hypothetical protein A2V83_07955 [Nitrospirae bacterium RBG_16_64_22]
MALITNALTIDVEEYFHATAFSSAVTPERWADLPMRAGEATRRLLDILASRGIRATFFVLGWVAERDPGLVRAIRGAGHEVASHGYGHRPIRGDGRRDGRKEFIEDTLRSKRLIEDLIGEPVKGYRATTFSIVRETLWALDVLAEMGFAYDSSIFPIRHDRYGIPDAPRFPHRHSSGLIEVPPGTARVLGQNVPIAGGGYFRLFPPSFTRWGIRRVNEKEKMPVVFYVHPWEIDPGQPRLPAGRLTRIRHYRNLDRTEERLSDLLETFRFGTIGEMLENSSEFGGKIPEIVKGGSEFPNYELHTPHSELAGAAGGRA